MMLQIYSIRDKAVEAFGRPFFLATKGECLRVFMDLCGDPQSNLFKHPADYSVWHLGEFNDQNAEISLLPEPVRLFGGEEFGGKE